MAEKKDMEMLSAILGGAEPLQMLQRMERLKKLMGTPQLQRETEHLKTEGSGDLFARSKNEDMITAAIPFLDREYRKGVYVLVRLMEMRRVLEDGFLETRERQEEPPDIRKQKMMHAIQPFLREEERKQMDMFIKLMAVRKLAGQEGKE